MLDWAEIVTAVQTEPFYAPVTLVCAWCCAPFTLTTRITRPVAVGSAVRFNLPARHIVGQGRWVCSDICRRRCENFLAADPAIS